MGHDRRLRGLLVLVLALGVLGSPATSQGADPAPNKCGWPTADPTPPRNKCFFYTKGIPLRFHGTSQATSGASVEVWVTVDGWPELDPVFRATLSCKDTGTTFASCGTGYPDETTEADLPHQASSAFVKMWCHVRATGTFSFACSAGS